MRVTTVEFIKNYGALADRALTEPVTITMNGRDRLVVVSLTEEQVALIAKAEVPVEYTSLDVEVADWLPVT